MWHLMTVASLLVLSGAVPAVAAAKPDAVLSAQDSRAGDSSALRKASRSGPAARRISALRAMGRIQAPAYADAVIAQLKDRDPAVRSEAAFSLGQLAMVEIPEEDIPAAEKLSALRARAARALKPLAADNDPAVREAAVEALGKTGGQDEQDALLKAFRDASAQVRGEAALAVFRGRYLKLVPEYSTAAVGALLEASNDPDAGVRWKAVYAFSRWGEPRAAEALVRAAGDQDVVVRLFALRALGQLKKEAPLDALLKAVKDPDAAVRREAVAALGAGGRSELLDASVYHDLSAQVRAAAAEAIAASSDEKLAARLDGLDSESSPLVRGAALLALPKLRRDAAQLLAKERTFPHWWVRSRAYLAMGQLLPGSLAELREGLADADPRVAAAALEAVAKSTEAFADQLLADVLRDPKAELEVLSTAVDAAGERKNPGLRAPLGLAAQSPLVAAYPELRDDIVQAAAAILKAHPDLPIPWLDSFKKTPPKKPELSPFLGEKPKASVVVFETEKGEIEISLAAEEAPVHAATFLHGVGSGFYDGKVWHRVVPGFVIQGGDPRGSGWGGAGFTLRDEINRSRFERGTVGMPKAGKDTGGCQLFITHLPTPHLDGRYTAFGRVTRGMDVVDRIEPGDKIIKARVLAQP